MNSVDKCVAGAGGAPLTKKQKQEICIVAREAWEKLGRPGFDDQAEGLPPEIRMKKTEAYTLWRRDEQRKAGGSANLTCSSNGQFARLMEHFCRLAGRKQSMAHWSGRKVGDAQRQAMARLRRECDKARDVIEEPEAYVASIARSKYKTPAIEDLSPRQVTVLTFDLRRGAQKRRAKAEGVPF